VSFFENLTRHIFGKRETPASSHKAAEADQTHSERPVSGQEESAGAQSKVSTSSDPLDAPVNGLLPALGRRASSTARDRLEAAGAWKRKDAAHQEEAPAIRATFRPGLLAPAPAVPQPAAEPSIAKTPASKPAVPLSRVTSVVEPRPAPPQAASRAEALEAAVVEPDASEADCPSSVIPPPSPEEAPAPQPSRSADSTVEEQSAPGSERSLNLGRQPQNPLLTDLVRLNPTRVRLENAILNGDRNGALPYTTVRAYVDAGEMARARFLRCVENFGRLSADQLDELVAQADWQITRDVRGDSAPQAVYSAEAIRRSVAAMFADRETEAVLAPFPVPARFRNAMFVEGWLALPFSNLLEDFPDRCATLLGRRNMGRGSVEAGAAVVRRIVHAELKSRGLEERQADAAVAAVLEDRELTLTERTAGSVGLDALGRAAGSAGLGPNGAERAAPSGAFDAAYDFSADAGVLAFVADLFGDETARDSIGPFAPPARLDNVLRNSGWSERPYRDFVMDFPLLERQLLRFPNMGRGSLDAWRKIGKALIESKLERLGLTGPAIEDVVALALDGRALSRTERLALATMVFSDRVSESGGEQVLEIEPPAPERPKEPQVLLAPLLAGLDQRTQQVIGRRYGLSGPRETLEQISQSYSLTRERIRQVEAKGVRRLRRQAQADVLASLSAFGDRVWAELAGGPVLLSSQLGARRRNLSGWIELAMDIAEIRLSGWLDGYAQRSGQAWAAPGYELERLAGVRQKVRAVQSSDFSPFALQSFGAEADGLTLAELRTAVQLEGHRLFGDYVVPGRLGARLRRTARLHHKLVERNRPCEIVALLADYVRRWPDDRCSSRDLELVMENHPQLFLEVYEGVWSALGVHGQVPDGAPAVEETGEEPDAETALAEGEAGGGGDDFTICESIVAELRRAGPLRISELIERAPAFLPPGRSPHSVGPILLSNKDLFARPLPGVYALHHQVLADDDLLKAKPSFLFEERHVRTYAIARHAGEPFGAYRLWTPAVEYLWCHWARRHADTDLLEALLSVAQPEAWPDVHDRDDWRALKQERGRYGLGVEPRDEAYGLPELEQVLAACLFIRDRGDLNWVSANRIQYRRPTDHTAAGLLALLVAIGVLQEGAPHWQAAHTRGDDLPAVLERLEIERVRHGVLHWQGEAGLELLERARAARPTLGWVTAERIVRLLGRCDAQPEATPAAIAPAPMNFLDELLADQSRRHEEARLAGALAELGLDEADA
jgi:hypothetical protein